METTEPINLSDITSGLQQTLQGMGLQETGAKKVESIIRAHVNKNAVLNNFSKKTLRFMLWKICKTLYKDMTRNREEYGGGVSKETIVTVVVHTLYLALNRGVDGDERNMFYGEGLKKMFDDYVRDTQGREPRQR